MGHRASLATARGIHLWNCWTVVCMECIILYSSGNKITTTTTAGCHQGITRNDVEFWLVKFPVIYQGTISLWVPQQLFDIIVNFKAIHCNFHPHLQGANELALWRLKNISGQLSGCSPLLLGQYCPNRNLSDILLQLPQLLISCKLNTCLRHEMETFAKPVWLLGLGYMGVMLPLRWGGSIEYPLCWMAW